MKILAVSHAANRSGAPSVLLELLRFLKAQTAHETAFASLRAGELEPEFVEVAQRFAGEKSLRRAALLAALERRIGDFPLPKLGQIRSILRRATRFQHRFSPAITRQVREFDLVYANCAISGEAFLGAPWPRGVTLVAHIHELKWALEQAGAGWRFLRENADFFVAASEAVARELREGQGIPESKIGVVHEFMDFSRLETDREVAKQALRQSLGLPHDAFLVGGCGTAEWRKGTDFWASVAALCAENLGAGRRAGEVHFAWMGARQSEFLRGIKFDIARRGLENRVHFLAPQAQTREFFASLDAFALCSREDPFPLVAIEATAQGVPVVCFDQAGGAPELVAQNAGAVVPYGDIAAMARVLQSWRHDATFRVQIGQNAVRRARQMCETSVGAPRILEMLEALAK